MCKNQPFKKILLFILVLCLTLCQMMQATAIFVAPKLDNKNDKANAGIILHAWNWKFKDIQDHIVEIRDAGYSSVQVSPVQKIKSGCSKDENGQNTTIHRLGSWWAFYQPVNFEIGNELGSRESFVDMCNVAHENGIKIIVDVVANHMANKFGEFDKNGLFDRSDEIIKELRDNKDCWHQVPGRTAVCDSYNGIHPDRYNMTQGSFGLPGLNKKNKVVQQKIISFLEDCIEAGADGFRFDAAKHIEVPGETFKGYDFGSDFWPTIVTVINKKGIEHNKNIYIYGEVLNDNDIPEDIMQKYLKYMNITDSQFGNDIRQALVESKFSHLILNKISTQPKNLVTWVESHDNYASFGCGPSFDLNNKQIILGWAIVASRQGASPVYLSRPAEKDVDIYFINSQNQRAPFTNGFIGGPGDKLWNSDVVKKINEFNKKMKEEKECIRLDRSQQVMMIERGDKGIVLANISQYNQMICMPTSFADGDYLNKINPAETFQVTNKQLKGIIDKNSVVVIEYDSKK